MIKYNRVVLKLSGESLQGKFQHGIDPEVLTEYALQIKELISIGIEVGIVIGGGNIFRGMSGTSKGFDRCKGDQMGMLATVVNSLALASALESLQIKARVLTAIAMQPIGEFYTKELAIKALEKGEVAIFGAGTGNPFFTTDTAASLRAIEVGADVMLKGTRVDGIFTADPEKDPDAVKFDKISFDEIYSRGLRIMDLTATTLCKENNLPVIVFNMDKKGSLLKVVHGEPLGTYVYNE
jgi:uridylate kinase